ncbi:MAG: glycine cleavage system protein H [Gemmatimonadota bacterium]
MEPPRDRRYAKAHVWAQAGSDGDVRVGFTHVPCAFLGDVVHVELPAPGTDVLAGEPIGLVESSSAVCELLSPLTGIVVAVNDALEVSPDRITADPYGDGWLFALRPSDPTGADALLDADAYARLAADD